LLPPASAAAAYAQLPGGLTARHRRSRENCRGERRKLLIRPSLPQLRIHQPARRLRHSLERRSPGHPGLTAFADALLHGAGAGFLALLLALTLQRTRADLSRGTTQAVDPRLFHTDPSPRGEWNDHLRVRPFRRLRVLWPDQGCQSDRPTPVRSRRSLAGALQSGATPGHVAAAE